MIASLGAHGPDVRFGISGRSSLSPNDAQVSEKNENIFVYKVSLADSYQCTNDLNPFQDGILVANNQCMIGKL